jgi:hypothetical protein
VHPPVDTRPWSTKPVAQLPRPPKQVVEATKPEEEPENWNSLTADEKWKVKPNRRARELQGDKDLIQKEIQEPEYALHYAEIRDGMWEIMAQMQRFSNNFLKSEKPVTVDAKFFSTLASETAKVIGCVASGGPGSVKGWHDLFIEDDKRRALSCAIMGNVLVEQVFQHMFFGGSAAQIETLIRIQADNRNADGKSHSPLTHFSY